MNAVTKEQNQPSAHLAEEHTPDMRPLRSCGELPAWSPFGPTQGQVPRRHGRDYLPGVGRWLSRDPIGVDGGDWNLYRYVTNDPANKTDPSGRGPCPDAHELTIINKICRLDRYLYDINSDDFYAVFNAPETQADIQWLQTHDAPAFPQGEAQATTECQNCPNSPSKCVGVTSRNPSFFHLPLVYQNCINGHEQRRRQCCWEHCSIGLCGANDHWHTLNCVWSYLRSTCGIRDLSLLVPCCVPPPPPGGPGCIADPKPCGGPISKPVSPGCR
jgi:hypothetical protein